LTPHLGAVYGLFTPLGSCWAEVTRTIDKADLKLQLQEAFGQHFIPGHNDIVGTALPGTEAELRKLILCTRESGVPLIPRGAGSSPFGGAPSDDAVVLRTDHLNQTLEVDKQRQLARVQAGVVWRDLIELLRGHGLMPRVYPSSASFSTIGGFVAQGGVGIGSFQYGSILDCVASVRLMGANGEIVELDGGSSDLAVGAESRTGILLDVVLRLQTLASMEAAIAVFSRAADMEMCLADAARTMVPLWSVSMMDRSAVDLNNKLQGGAFTLLPGRYAVLFSFRREDRMHVLPRLRGTILGAGGRLMPAGDDHDEWVKRFMGLQALGTTPVPMQFHVPLGELAPFIHAIPAELRRRLAFEGVMADIARCATVRFFLMERPDPAQDNTAVARELLRLARQHGGGAYATGAHFLDQAEEVYGEDRLRRMTALHAAMDPAERLNPGMAFSATQEPA
jgi:FAD/FMN-containing dehydrogenase